MLDLQVLILTLMPLFSGVAPQETSTLPSSIGLVGVSESVSADFMLGKWKWLDQFSKWGLTDKEKSRVTTSEKQAAFLEINSDGTYAMSNLFRPVKGRWEISEKGLIIYDPLFPERGTQLIPVRKRDENRIWLLLPFSGGSVGIGMIRDTQPVKAN
ncbi:MAG: hypothetical protein V1897_04810 [Pseudomonadota bacterium]